jgi:hypothetical protein
MPSEPNIYAFSLGSSTLVRSTGLELRENNSSNAERGLSSIGRAIVLGTYGNSFDKETSQWICSNFFSQDPPISDMRPQNDNMEWHYIGNEAGCPSVKFLVTKGTVSSDAVLYRQMMGLSKLPNTPNLQTSDTV